MSTPIANLPYNPPTELPPRDIPRETIAHVADPQVMPNYVPPPPPPQPPSPLPTKPEWTEEAKLPLILALLFFLFNSVMVNTTIMKTFPSFFQPDGNITTNGLVFKSLLYGCAYYGVMKFIVT